MIFLTRYQLQQHRALLVALGLAVVFHGLLWACWPQPKVTMTEQEGRPALTVQLAWSDPIHKAPRLVLPHAVEHPNERMSNLHTNVGLVAGQSPAPDPVEITPTAFLAMHDAQEVKAHAKQDAPIAEAPAAPSQASPSQSNTHGWALRNMALQMARDEGKRMVVQAQENTLNLALADRPILPGLAAAMNPHKKLEASVTMSPDGMVKVVNAQGLAYCMMTVSQGPKTGPLEPDAIPMTCP